MDEIRLDRDGQFFFNGAPCVRREITDLFFEKLESDGAGGYRIRLGEQLAPVVVEEAPLRVHNLIADETAGGTRLLLCLDGGLLEPFEPGTLRFEGDVPWCRARGLDARFTPTGALALGELHYAHGGQASLRSCDTLRQPSPPCAPRTSRLGGSAGHEPPPGS